ncbi:AraD1 family protein [Saccharospirillum sp. HFRX-1]|uniref:AraD1 family protein n=1 Tax=unclassified Saccharospirillum TaxID=2633430 RepID=UPI00371E23B5
MRLIQYLTDDNQPAIGRVISDTEIQPISPESSLYYLAKRAISEGISLEEAVQRGATDERLDYQKLIDEQRLLAPFAHPDPAHLFVTGTGLTHLGSADTRDSMHAKTQGKSDAELTDSMKMFRQGVEGGKPANGTVGAQPEWFYKGDGSIVAAPGKPLRSPAFALDGGEEPEIVGCYLIDDNGQPWRLGFALGNEFSDHQTERQNYLLLAHSKLRPCAVGPELLVGDLPQEINGMSRLRRGDKVVWEKPFVSGEANMSHSLANLEHHHFKYELFRRPGDAHLHFFGTATLSFADGIEAQEGDVFEIEARDFGRALRNPLKTVGDEKLVIVKGL